MYLQGGGAPPYVNSSSAQSDETASAGGIANVQGADSTIGAVVMQRVDQDPAHDRSFLSSSHATIFSTVSLVSSSSMIWPAALAGGAAKSEQCARALS